MTSTESSGSNVPVAAEEPCINLMLLNAKAYQIRSATERASLPIPPGDQLKALKAGRKGQHSHQ
jgi:hypothetical protein